MTWDDLAGRLADSVAEVTQGRFLVVDYTSADTGAVNPYAQMAHTGGDPLCEVVSAWHLGPDEWPLNELALLRDGWSPPYGRQFPNWWRYDLIEPEDIARGLLDALRLGRGCTDPLAFRWHIGRFPTPPGGGEEIYEHATVHQLHAVAA